MITYLLENHPVLVWAFFFGLVLASTWFVSKEIKKWNWQTVLCFITGAVIAFYITVATPAETPGGLWFIFLCGAIAICAMILPGISGSFILVLLGKYYYIMEAVRNFDLVTLLVFLCGAIIGITSFSRVLSYTLRNHHDVTIAILSGFMLGSLNKVWPWKDVAESNILPDQFIWQGIALMAAGFGIVYLLEKLSNLNHPVK
jgi:putative membrane protein